MIRTLLPVSLILALAACGGNDSGGNTSTTKLDAVEVEPGTISDSMIILDDASADGTAVDNSVPGDESKKAAPKSSEESPDEEATSGAEDSANSEDATSTVTATRKADAQDN
ncbi:MAG: hypothetical protein U0S50_06290 [Sphingopyxis sp.]|uniref:hypothetical protein n=1 Tax=Sphingopyxis sp. TaxID=1908224 RepID=UPI002ABB40A9|nr:hypothetical protein [Sphingopyxis sp.]MDZ3831410.1 hypothetical protein [Sphingopyxis sp.]